MVQTFAKHTISCFKMVLVLMLHLGVALLTEVYCDRIVMDGDARVLKNYLRVARFSMYILQSGGL